MCVKFIKTRTSQIEMCWIGSYVVSTLVVITRCWVIPCFI